MRMLMYVLVSGEALAMLPMIGQIASTTDSGTIRLIIISLGLGVTVVIAGVTVMAVLAFKSLLRAQESIGKKLDGNTRVVDLHAGSINKLVDAIVPQSAESKVARESLANKMDQTITALGGLKPISASDPRPPGED